MVVHVTWPLASRHLGFTFMIRAHPQYTRSHSPWASVSQINLFSHSEHLSSLKSIFKLRGLSYLSIHFLVVTFSGTMFFFLFSSWALDHMLKSCPLILSAGMFPNPYAQGHCRETSSITFLYQWLDFNHPKTQTESKED